MVALREVVTRLGFQTNAGELNRYESQVRGASQTMQRVGDDAGRTVSRLSNVLGGVGRQLAMWASGIAGVAGLRSVTTQLAEQTHQMRVHASAVGMTVEDYSRLQHASSQFVEETGKDMRDFLADLADYGRDALANPTGGYAMDLKALGVELVDANGKLKTQFDLMLAVSESITKVPLTSERMGIMSAVFSTGALEMAEFLQLGPEGIKAQMAAVDSAAVLTKEQTKTAAEYRAAMHGMMTVLNTLRMQIGQKIMPFIARIAKGVTAFLKDTENLERMMRRLIQVGRILLSVLAASFAAKGITAMVLNIWKLVGAIRSATIWTAALKTLWLAIPIIIAAVGLLIDDAIVWLRGGDSLIGRFIKKYEGSNGPAGKIARWLVGFKPKLAAFVGTVGEWITRIKGWAMAAKQAIQAAIPPVVSAIQRAVAWVAPYATAAYEWLRLAIPAAINTALTMAKTAWGWIASALGWLWDEGPGAIGAVVDAAIWLWGWIKRIGVAVGEAAVAAWGWTKRAGVAIAEVATMVGKWVWARMQELWTAFAPWAYGFAKLVQGLAKVVWGAIKGVGVVLMELWNGIWPLIQSLGRFLWENIPPVINVIVQGLRIAWHAVLLIVEWVGKFFAMLAVGSEWILSKAAKVVEGIIIAVAGFAAAIVSKASELVAWIIEKLSPLTAWIFEKIGAVGGWIADGLQAFNKGVSSFLAWLNTNLVQPIQGLFASIGTVIKNIFGEVMKWIQPVIDLIDSTLGKAHKAAVMLGLADEEQDAATAATVQKMFELGGGSGFGAVQRGFEADARAQMQSGAALTDFARSFSTGNLNAGGITLNFNGTPNMGAQEIATAVKSGVEQGMTTARDLAVGE